MSYAFDGINYTQLVTMSGSQLDAYNTTPFQLIAAPGANKVIMLRRIQTIFIQTGPNFYTADSGIAMCWNNTPMSDPPPTPSILAVRQQGTRFTLSGMLGEGYRSMLSISRSESINL